MNELRRHCLLLALVLAAGCGGVDAPAEDAGTGADATAAGELMIPGEAPPDESASGTSFDLPREQALNLQANHPNGTVLTVDRVVFAPDHIALDLTVTNGHRSQIALNRFTHRQTRLLDNTGATYNLSPPAQNPEIRVEPGTTIEARLVFLGRVSPDAHTLTLTTNHRRTGNGEVTTTPTIVIDGIPVERS